MRGLQPILDDDEIRCLGAGMIKILFCVMLISLCGCTAYNIDNASNQHRQAASYVSLGDSKEKVLKILLPTQAGLTASQSKSPEKFMKGKDLIEIYFMRSGRQPDGLTTDDEFTPYYFRNDILTGIGWQQLGGAKSHGKVIPQTNVNTSTTIIDY